MQENIKGYIIFTGIVIHLNFPHTKILRRHSLRKHL